MLMAHLSHQPRSWQEMETDQFFGSQCHDRSLCRYRMELDLRKVIPGKWPSLASGYHCSNWRWSDCEDFASALYQSFADSPDTQIIPSFRSWDGCKELTRLVAQSSYFWPSATQIIRIGREPVACIQVMGGPDGKINIQNIGVIPGHRGLGLGSHLLGRALATIHKWGMPIIGLEVTADNRAAIKMYESFGFQRSGEVWKKVVPTDGKEPLLISLPDYPASGATGSH